MACPIPHSVQPARRLPLPAGRPVRALQPAEESSPVWRSKADTCGNGRMAKRKKEQEDLAKAVWFPLLTTFIREIKTAR